MSKMHYRGVALQGELITAVDPSTIGENFAELTNMRYTPTAPRSIGGMTKINTEAISNYIDIENGFHFYREDSQESHVLVQAWNSAGTSAVVMDNYSSAIPEQSSFSATAVFSDTSGGDIGYFSDAPAGFMAYSNSKEDMIWAGNVAAPGKVVNYDPAETFRYDITDLVVDSDTGAHSTATLKRGSVALDSDTVLLLHLDANTTDSSQAPVHTVTKQGTSAGLDYVTNTSTPPFGTKSVWFDSANAEGYFSIPDHADFDFSGGIFTVEFWVNENAYPASGHVQPLYYQQTDASNYISLRVTSAGALSLVVVAAGVTVVTVLSAGNAFAGGWQHVAAVENGDNWYLFIGGQLIASAVDTSRAANYTGSVLIGYDGTDYVKANGLDEIRISKAARYTAAFSPPTAEFSDTGGGSSYATYLKVGTVAAIDAIGVTVETANTSAGTVTAYVWNGDNFAECTGLSDGTSSAGITLAQTGVISFDSTKATARVGLDDGLQAFWYLLSFNNMDETTQISNLWVKSEFQQLTDIWDGEARSELSFLTGTETSPNDYTLNVYDDDYSEDDSGTYATLSALSTASSVFAGFSEQMMGLQVRLPALKTNSQVGAILTVYYWDGDDWTSVGTLNDETMVSTYSFGKTGYVWWNPPDVEEEFKKRIAGVASLFYYKLSWSVQLSSGVRVSNVTGIPAPKRIQPHKFPVYGWDRLWLCSEVTRDKNAVTASGLNSPVVFNGSDSQTFLFGDNSEITAGGALYNHMGGEYWNLMVFYKARQTWILVGKEDQWEQYQISDQIGCAAPRTHCLVPTPQKMLSEFNGTLSVFQGAAGIYIFDGRYITPISTQIEDRFDQKQARAINPDMLSKSRAFYDSNLEEYHWLYAEGDSTSIDKEMVFSFRYGKWFEVSRGTGKALQCGVQVRDTNNNQYVYGAIDGGYLERLENGTTFDGNDIVSTLRLADLALYKDNPMVETLLRVIKLTMKAKTVTANSVAVTHFADLADSGTSHVLSPAASGKRVAQATLAINVGRHNYHGLKFSMTTDNETIGFEPMLLTLGFEAVGEDK